MGTDIEPVIEPGSIKVNTVAKVIDHENCKVWLVDCRSKYYDVTYGTEYSSDGTEEIAVDLWLTERTLHAEQGQQRLFTRICFPVPEEETRRWAVMAEGGRYETRVVMYRLGGDL